MTVLRRLLLAGVIAGVVVGIVVAVIHLTVAVPMIQQAETFEQSAAAPTEWWPADGFERTAYTVLADIVVGIGTGLLLVAAYTLRGTGADWRRGVYWGLAGFAAFSLWPGIGLVPNLPAAALAPHIQRYVWWGVTATMAASGLGLLFLTRRPALVILGVILLLLPQIYGAPQPVQFDSAIPESLARQFAVTVHMTNFVFWVLLGGTTGFFYERFQEGVTAFRTAP